MEQLNSPPMGVDELLGEALAQLPPMAEHLRACLAPLAEQRNILRSVLGDAGALRTLPSDGTYLSLAAVDGAYTLAPLFVGDQINILALATQSELHTGNVSIEGRRSINEFFPHAAGNEMFARTMMLAAELELLSSTSDDGVLTVIDGSHTTAITAIFEALSIDGPAQERICDDVMSDQIISSLEDMAERDTIIACPKSDSSTAVYNFAVAQGVHIPVCFPDKVLASLVLDPGESMTLDTLTPAWGRYDITSEHITSPKAQALRDRVHETVAGLRTGIRVALVKPPGSSTAIRVETKASVDDFETVDHWQAVVDDCAPPYTQEPVAQYIADYFAKSVSEIAKAQLDTARLDLAESADDELLEFLIRSYRTN